MNARAAAATPPLPDGATSNELDRRKDEFIAMLAHELRGPLAPIRMAAAILSQPHAAAAVCEQASTIIDRQVNDMARLIDELLDVARMTQGKLQVDVGRMDLIQVVQRSLDVVRGAVAEREQHLSVSLPSGPCYVQGDRGRLQQVFGNLLTNASKFSKRGGRIWLTVDADASSEPAGNVSVHVRDEGIGITPSRLAHIFKLFEQAGVSPHGARGLGVGLALVQQIVQLHGGRVRAESAGPDHGSAFTVMLPLEAGTGVKLHQQTSR